MLILQQNARRIQFSFIHLLKYQREYSKKLSYQNIVQAYFSSTIKKDKRQREEDRENELYKFEFQKQGLVDLLQKEIFLKDYEAIMEREQKAMFENDMGKASSQVYSVNMDQFSDKIELIKGRSDKDDESDVVVINKDIKLIQEYLKDALDLLRDQKLEQCLDLLFKCVMYDCNNFCIENEVYKIIGKVYSQLNDIEKAIKYYSKQIESERTRNFADDDKRSSLSIHSSLLLLAAEYEKMRKNNQACSLYQLCLRIQFDPQLCLHLASILFHSQHLNSDAIKYFEKVYSFNPQFFFSSFNSQDYFECLLIQKKYVKIEKLLKGNVDESKYLVVEGYTCHSKQSLNHDQHKDMNIYKTLSSKYNQVMNENLLKDWRLLFIYRLGYMYTNKSFNYYVSFIIQSLKEVIQTDLTLRQIRNREKFNELRDNINLSQSLKEDMNHIEILQTIADSTSLIKNRGVQDELSQFESYIDIHSLKQDLQEIDDAEIQKYLSEFVFFTRKIDLEEDQTIYIKRQDLYTAYFPFVNYMLRFLYSHFHKNGFMDIAEYFILQEIKIYKNDLSTLSICKKLYEKDNLQLYTALLIDFYESNKLKLAANPTELLLEIYSNCKKLGLYNSAVKYINVCLTQKQNQLTLDQKRSLIVQAAYLYYSLDQTDLFIQFYNQIKNLNRYPQLKIFYHIQSENYDAVKTLIETNFTNKKNTSILNSEVFYEYYIISILKLGLYQNLDNIVKRFSVERNLLSNSKINFILYSKLLFACKQYKYVIQFMNFAMESSATSLSQQGSDNLCQINFYLCLSHFFLKQYDSSLRHSDTFITLYNAKQPHISHTLSQMETFVILSQIIIFAKQQQISISQDLLEMHKTNIQEFTGKSICSDQILQTVAELEYAMLKKSIDDTSHQQDLQLHLKQLKKYTDLSILE